MLHYLKYDSRKTAKCILKIWQVASLIYHTKKRNINKKSTKKETDEHKKSTNTTKKETDEHKKSTNIPIICEAILIGSSRPSRYDRKDL